MNQPSVSYAFSLDREQFSGRYATREEALAAGIGAAHKSAESPPTVYVAKMVPGNAQSAGHGPDVVLAMTRRARDSDGGPSYPYLANLSGAQVQQLDQALQETIMKWLIDNRLWPAYYKAQAVSEHAVPPAPMVSNPTQTSEVQDPGSADYSPDV